MVDLIKQGNSAVFTATEGEFPYSNGKIAVPLGSLTYVIDESERIDFKSAYNGNIVTTSTIGSLMVDGEIVTKDNAIEKLDAVIGGTSGGGGSDPRVDQLIKDVAKKQDKLNNITEIPDEAIFVGKLNDEGQPIGGVVAVGEDGVVQIEASDLSVGKDGETYIYANGEDVNLNGNVTVNGSTVLTEASVKTINGESIVGEGDIEIKGGGEKVTVYYQKSGGYNPSAITYDVGEVIDFTTLLSASTYEYVTIENYTTSKLTFRNSSGSALTIKLLTLKGGNYSSFASSFEYKTTINSIIIDAETSGGSTVTQWQKANAEVVYYKQRHTSGKALKGKVRTIIDTPIALYGTNNSPIKSIGLEGSDADVILTNNVTVIDNSGFRQSEKLTNVTLPNTVTVIGNYAFYLCSSLTSITIPTSVTTIGTSAFESVPTSGTLYCDEDWFNSLTSTQKSNLGNVGRNWTRMPLPLPLDERVDDLDERVTALEEGGGGGYQYVNEDTESKQLMLGEIPSEGDPMAAIMVDGNSGDVQILGMQSTSLLSGNVNISNLDATSSISVSDGGVNIVGSANINEAPIVVQENFSYDPSTKTLSINFL